MNRGANRRILLVDDNPAIHDDYKKILGSGRSTSSLDEQAALLFGTARTGSGVQFQLESAFQGEEALARILSEDGRGLPFAAVFMDIRMPPGWDGVETIRRIWDIDRDVETVICSAYSDYSWEDVQKALGTSDRLLILKKPFDTGEVQQMALTLTERWNARRLARERTRELERLQVEKNEILAHLGQELGTFVDGVLGLASLLDSLDHSSQQTSALSDLQRCGGRLQELLQRAKDVQTRSTADGGRRG